MKKQSKKNIISKQGIGKARKIFSVDDEKLARLFSVLGDLCRLRIVKVLLNNKDLCVTGVAKICDITPSAASQQLKILELSGIVARKRMGQKICYEIRRQDVLVKYLVGLIKSW